MRDQVEIYNIPKFTEHFEQKHPKIINDRIAEVEEFAKVSRPILISGPSSSPHASP